MDVLRCGAIIHRDNYVVESIKDVFIRSHYRELHKICSKKSRVSTTFFTGTPGVGKSVMRTYFVWKRIQNAITNKDTVIVWMSKSPGDSAEICLIKDGKLAEMKSVSRSDYMLLNKKINNAKIPLYSFVDCSEGMSDNVLVERSGHYRMFFSSPNEKAWKEKIKLYGKLLCVPTWTVDELVNYYFLACGCNEVLIQRLLVKIQ